MLVIELDVRDQRSEVREGGPSTEITERIMDEILSASLVAMVARLTL